MSILVDLCQVGRRAGHVGEGGLGTGGSDGGAAQRRVVDVNIEDPVVGARQDLHRRPMEEEFRTVYERHYGAILAYCLRRLASADAHDATAEVFSIAWRKFDAAPEGEKVRSWLYGIAYRVVGHQWRSRRRSARLRAKLAGLRHSDPVGPEAAAVQSARLALVLRASEQLRETDREILRLAGWEELPHAEIATLLGISVAAVDQRVHRAKRRLAEAYQRLDDGPSPAVAGGGGR